MQNNENNNENNDSSTPKFDKTRVGGLWKRKSKKTGKGFLSGFINIQDDFGKEMEYPVIIFPTIEKKHDRDVDFIVYSDGEPKERTYGQKAESKPAPKPQESNASNDGEDDDVPF